MVEIFYFV